MITAITPRLVFDGSAADAVAFYVDALGASASPLLRWGEMDPECPADRRHLVIHGHLTIGTHQIMVSDEHPDSEYTAKSNVGLCLMVDSADEAHRIYTALVSAAREVEMPLGSTEWSEAYASLTDRYGVRWEISTITAQADL